VSHALAINPKYERCYFVQGCIYEKKGQWKLAVAEFNKFLDCNPDSDIMPVDEAKERLKICESAQNFEEKLIF
jgi:tetratricopeptide (TPR) repeat protein